MKIQKPLMVKLSAGLLAACGILLPSTTQAEWWSTEGNWVLRDSSTRQDAIFVPNEYALLDVGSSWLTFDPNGEGGGSSAIYFMGDGLLLPKGGTLTIDASYSSDGSSLLNAVAAWDEGDLTIGNWGAESAISVTNHYQYGEAIGLLGAADVIISGNLAGAVHATAAEWAAGIASGYDVDGVISISGNLSGTVTGTASGYESYSEVYAEGLYSDSGISIGGDLSGTVSGKATAGYGYSAEAIGLEAWTGNLAITGAISGTVTADAAAFDSGGDAYASGLYADSGSLSIGSIAGTAAITATATTYGSNGEATAYGLYGNDTVAILGDVAEGSVISASARSTAWVSNSYAYGIYAATGDVTIGPLAPIGLPVDDVVAPTGNLAGAISATAEDEAYGIYAFGKILVTGDLSGTVSAEASPDAEAVLLDVSPSGQAIGLYGKQGVQVTGALSGAVTAHAISDYNSFGPGYTTEAVGIQGDLVLTPPEPPPLSPGAPPVTVADLGISIGSITGSVTAQSLINIPEVGSPTGSRTSSAYGLKSNASIGVTGGMSVAAALVEGEPITLADISVPEIVGIMSGADFSAYNIKAEATGRTSATAYGMSAAGNITLGDLLITDAAGEPVAPVNAVLNGTANICATASATSYVSNSYAYGIYADGNVGIGKMAGGIVASAEDDAYAVQAGNQLIITGDFSGVAAVAAMPMGDPATDKSPSAYAVGLSGTNGVIITGDLSGVVGAMALTNFGNGDGPEAAAIMSDNGTISIGSISGMVAALADDSYDTYAGNGQGRACGLYGGLGITIGTPPNTLPADDLEPTDGNISGTIRVASSDTAYGMYVNAGTIKILGSITDTAEIRVDGVSTAEALRAFGNITIGGDLAGTITVTASGTDAMAAGLDAKQGSILISGDVSGSISATSSGSAFGMVAQTLPPTSPDALPNGFEIPLLGNLTIGGDISGTITATGVSQAFGLATMNDLTIEGNITSSAVITATASAGDAYGLASMSTLTIGVLPDAAAPVSDEEPPPIGDVAGTITVTATGGNAYGVFAGYIPDSGDITPPPPVAPLPPSDASITILGDISGTITVTASGANGIEAYGLYSDNAISIGNLATAGRIYATAAATDYVSNSYAYGIYAAAGNVAIGDLAGDMTIRAEDEAYGLYASQQIAISGDLSGTITARAEPMADPSTDKSPQGQAIGLYGSNGVTITGALSGTILAHAATNFNAFGYNTEAIGIRGDLLPSASPAPDAPVVPIGNGITLASITGSVTAESVIAIDEDGDGTGSYSSKAYGLKSNASISIGGITIAAPPPPPPPDDSPSLAPASPSDLDIPDFANSNIKATASGRGEVYAYGIYANGNVVLGNMAITGTGDAPILSQIETLDTVNIYAKARSTNYVSNSYAYGVYADGDVNTGTLGGGIFAGAEDIGYAVRAGDQLTITGAVSGWVAAMAVPVDDPATDKSPKADAVGLYGANGVTITGDVSGLVAAIAGTNYAGPWRPEAAAIKSSAGSINIGSISGMVAAVADDQYGDYAGNNVGYAYGLYGGQGIMIGTPVPPPPPVAPPPPSLPLGTFSGGDISGTIMAVSTDRAYGLYANTGDIRILGNITSAAAISATGEYKAQAIRSNGGIFIGTDMAGTLTATSDEGDAAGLYSDGDIAIGGKLSGTITVTADDDAFGIHAGGTLSNGSGGALEITGTISATGTSSSDGVKGVCAHGAMNLKVSGSISAFNDDGAAFAIKGLNNAVDTVELTTGAAITGIIDLGDEIHPVAPPTGPVPLPGGDRLILTGHNSLGGEIRDVEILDVNADADGWKLTYNCNTFGAINLNTGVFGICSGNSTNHVHTGAFNQFAGSTLAVQYDAGGDADIIWVENNGSASVDGTVRIVPVGPMTTETQVYTFISTNYSINGEYSALEKPAIVAAELQKSADGTDYQFTAARRTFSSFDDGIGEAMDKLYEDDYDSELMNLFLGMGTDGQVTDAMRQLEAATAPTSVALSGSQAFSTEITARLSAMRQGIAMARKNPNLGNLPSLAATGDAVIGEALRAAQVARTENHEWQITGRYLGNYGSLDSDTNANGGDWKGNGFMIDIDRQVTENLILGIGAGGSWTSVDIDNNGGEADVESFSARLYASWFDGPWHVDAQVGYGRNRNESTRNIDLFGLMQADGEWDADVYTASLGGGYDIELGKGWVLEPNAALDYTRIDNDGYTETGAGPFNLAVDSSEYDSLRSTIGLALRKDFNFDNGMILRPELRMGWRHEFLDTQVETGATFMGASFTSYGVKQNRESAVIGLGLNLQFNQALGGFISYDADLNTDQTVQAVSIGIRFNF